MARPAILAACAVESPAVPDIIRIVPATERDVPLLPGFIRELADYERLLQEVTATDDDLRRTLFGSRPAAEAVIAYDSDTPAGFAPFFPNYPTFLARPGPHLGDLL